MFLFHNSLFGGGSEFSLVLFVGNRFGLWWSVREMQLCADAWKIRMVLWLYGNFDDCAEILQVLLERGDAVGRLAMW